MIVGNDFEAAVERPNLSVAPKLKRNLRPYLWSLGVFGVCLACVVALQIASGAYRGEFGAYPDEPAHYVTSLMLREYITGLHWTAPLQFAEDYYRHYPKVAFGHWPPVFYILQSFWMMLFSASRASVRLEIAVTTALLAYALFTETRRWFGWQAGLLAGLLLVSLPLIQTYSDEEMAEALLTLTCFWSVIFFSRYVVSERPVHALLFGVFFSLAVLTKGSGWLLTMVPPIVLVLSRKIRLLGKASFWWPVLVIALVCLPWQLMTMRLAEQGWDGGSKPSLAYTLNALTGFLSAFPRILGPVLLALMLLGIGFLVLKPLLRGPVPPAAAGMFALLISVWIFHSVVPAGVEDRKLVIAVPAMLLFVFGGAVWLANLIPPASPFFSLRFPLVAAVSIGGFFTTIFSIPRLQHYGFTEAAHFLTSDQQRHGVNLLVSSESGGEGLLVSEMAMDQPQPRDVVIRATKALASVAWNGMNYHSTFTSSAQVSDYLKQHAIQAVVLDTFAPQIHFLHNSLLKQAIQHDHRYTLAAAFPAQPGGSPGQVLIYRLSP